MLLRHALFQRVRHVNGARPDQERLAPGAAEGRDIGGVGHHGGFDAIQRAQPHRGNLEHFAQLRRSLRRPRQWPALVCARIAHQADDDLGAGLIGDDVGRAAAADGSDVQRARPEQIRPPAVRSCRMPAERVEQFVDGRFAQFGISGVRHLACGCDLVAQRALGAERQLVFGGLAVDEESRSARLLRRAIGAGAVALLADDEQQPKSAAARFQQRFGGRESWRR